MREKHFARVALGWPSPHVRPCLAPPAFCTSCLDSWLPHKASCPACNAPVDVVQDLRAAQPLAWRMLGRIRVRCPLVASGACSWCATCPSPFVSRPPPQFPSPHLILACPFPSLRPRVGEYSEFSSHLLSSEAHRGSAAFARAAPADAAARARAEADALREAGNEKLSGRHGAAVEIS